MSEAPLIFIVAGEPSGDALGAALMAALRERTGGAVRFAGIGGEQMKEQGLASLVPLHELAIMGVTEVLPRARRIFRRVREMVAEITRLKPAAVVTIDSSGFTWRIAQRLREAGSKVILIHYVAPMVWAWRAGRAKRMARWYDHLMTLLPFEPKYFTAVGLPTTYVGHPVIESGADRGDGRAFRARHAIEDDEVLLCVLPGSRRGEVHRLMPVFGAVVARLARRVPRLRVVVPTVDTVAEMVTAAVASWPVPSQVVRGRADKYDAFAASHAALVASGTVALEIAMADVPAVVAYRANPVTSWLVRRMAKIRFVHLVNLVLDREIVPELLLEKCTADRIFSALCTVIEDDAVRAIQRQGYRDGLALLGRDDASPSRRAADQVLAVIAARAGAS